MVLAALASWSPSSAWPRWIATAGALTISGWSTGVPHGWLARYRPTAARRGDRENDVAARRHLHLAGRRRSNRNAAALARYRCHSSDDGYNLTIARVAPKAGYVANYYRYFGTTEAPFDWYLAVLAKLASVSTAGVWMRLRPRWPECVLAHHGIGCCSDWDPERVPGGQPGGRVHRGCGFPGRLLPFNNGLRPEPLIALGVLVTWMLVERAIALQRLAPAASRSWSRSSRRRWLRRVDRHRRAADRARAIAQTIRRRRPTDGLLAPPRCWRRRWR